MGDSDDDYDRRRARDKFRRERSDYQERRGEDRGRRDEYVDSRRDIWARDRGGGGRRDYRDVDMRRRERYSPPRHDMSPPIKKIRRNWDDHGYGNYDLPYSGSSLLGSHQAWGALGPEIGVHSPHGYSGPGGGPAGHRDIEVCPTQPPMMTFKQFLASQDDGISDEEAVRKYNDYKQEFRRQQLNEFFLTHKEEEWFKSKYQPEECVKRLQEQLAALNRRVEVFFELLDKKWIEEVAVDSDKGDAIIRLLDAVVIKLEGGSDSDLKVLDEAAELEKFEKIWSASTGVVNAEWKKKQPQQPEEAKEPVVVTEPTNESESDWDKDDDSGRPGSAASSNDAKAKVEKEKKEETKVEKEKEKKPEQEEAEEEEEEEEEGPPKEADAKSEEGSAACITEPTKSEESEKEQTVRPRPLHKTCSIFLRNLAPTITKQEVEAMCRRFPGFLRVAIADPQPERRFFRRGWVTFEREVNIKETCWHLNNIRLRDCELGAIVNRDLTRRIRSCNGITSHKQVVRADIRLSAKIIQMLDRRHDLWTEDKEKDENGQIGFGLISRNPLLKNITDYLIEEADAEEEELLGKSSSDETKKEGEAAETTVERDEALIKVLDRLLLYLRIVHSVDYYNHSDYPNEDEMPNRCGIMHARGPAPSIKVTQTEISEYINGFEAKMTPFLQPVTKLSDEEAKKLGKKDPIAEVDKFILSNTQELGKDKWLCPLSGKKFKGPEFVKKHIFNKHSEKIEEVKKEVEYFNNYLLDPKRPQLPEHPGNRPTRGEGGGRESMAHPAAGHQHPPAYVFGYGQGSRLQGNQGVVMDRFNDLVKAEILTKVTFCFFIFLYFAIYPRLTRFLGTYPPGYAGRGGFAESFRPGANFFPQKRGGLGRSNFQFRNRGDPREIVGYHDLDAPEDLELF